MDLVCWLDSWYNISTSLSNLSCRSVHALSQFLLHIFLLSPFDKAWSQGTYEHIAVVILTWFVQWLRLALSKTPNRVGVSPLT
jgi:hypothetical protein